MGLGPFIVIIKEVFNAKGKREIPYEYRRSLPSKCMLKEGHIYLFIFQKVVSKTMRIGLRWKVRSNQDKDINEKNILVLQHV
jgi:hypothetical protein